MIYSHNVQKRNVAIVPYFLYLLSYHTWEMSQTTRTFYVTTAFSVAKNLIFLCFQTLPVFYNIVRFQYTPKRSGFYMFSEGIEKNQWHNGLLNGLVFNEHLMKLFTIKLALYKWKSERSCDTIKDIQCNSLDLNERVENHVILSKIWRTM